jgi:cysteine-rich repeat protein
MLPQGATWSATIPPQPDGTVVRYQVTGTLDDGDTVRYPDNPADPLYQLFVGTAAEIWCERLDADPAWLQTGATEWEFGVTRPVNVAAGDPAAPFAGPGMLGTDLRGDGLYRPDITTTITTPPIDTGAYERVHLQFRRWLTVEDAALDLATIRVNGTQVWSNATTQAQTLDHVDREWRFVDVDLTPHALAPVAISWSLASDATRNFGGWNLDEICIVGLDKRALCGDGILDDGEACDDGNLEPGDGCSNACDDEADGGGCCETGTDPAGPLLLGLGVLALVRPRRRR